jgi:hypothetical protein
MKTKSMNASTAPDGRANRLAGTQAPGMTGDNAGCVYPGKFEDVDEPSEL